MVDSPRVGTRLSCSVCGNQVVVVKASQTQFTCCGNQPMAAPNSIGGHDVSSR